MSGKKKVEQVEKAVEVKQEFQPIVAEEKFVKVTPKFSGKRFIAGKWYNFVKDKEIEVTKEAKRVLLEANAIYI